VIGHNGVGLLADEKPGIGWKKPPISQAFNFPDEYERIEKTTIYTEAEGRIMMY